MNSNIPPELTNLKEIKSKFEKINNANTRRSEIIKNKDKIEKEFQHMSNIIDSVDKINIVDVDSFANSEREVFLNNFSDKKKEIEKRKIELKIVKDIMEEKYNRLKKFPDIINTEQFDEITQNIDKINEEINNCNQDITKLGNIKKKYEEFIKIQNDINNYMNIYNNSKTAFSEINDYEKILNENKEKFVNEINNNSNTITKLQNDLDGIYKKMSSELSKIPKNKVSNYEVMVNALEETKKYINKCKGLMSKILEEKKVILKKNELKKDFAKAIEIMGKTKYSNQKIIDELKVEIQNEVKNDKIKKIVLDFMDIHKEQKQFFAKFSKVINIIGNEWTFTYESNSLLSKYEFLSKTCHYELSSLKLDSSEIKNIIKVNFDKILKDQKESLEAAKKIKKETRDEKIFNYLAATSIGVAFISGIGTMITINSPSLSDKIVSGLFVGYISWLGVVVIGAVGYWINIGINKLLEKIK